MCKTSSYGPLCGIPSHHLRSNNIQNLQHSCYKGKFELQEKREETNLAETLILSLLLTFKASKHMYLMAIQVSKDFFLMLSREYSIKMSCNVHTKYLHFFFKIKCKTISNWINLKTIISHKHASYNLIAVYWKQYTIHSQINLRCSRSIHCTNQKVLYQ